jgi:predicted AAA+ superfamily ATPase
LPGKDILRFDLLDLEVEERLALNPGLFASEVALKKPRWVIVDEVQKIPPLLNTVHSIIENPQLSHTMFALTGSSARKLKRSGANLLAGRAFVNHLFPLTHVELGSDFDLHKALEWGTLPKVTLLESAREKAAFLRSYATTYLKEEVWAEHIIDKLEPFRKFLPICAQRSGEILNYTAIAKDVGVHDKTIKSYYQILEDTLLGFSLEPYHRSLRKRQKKASKFFLFDTGVVRALQGTLRVGLTPGGFDYGKAFEQWLIGEFHRLSSYQEDDAVFSYIGTDSTEIDLIIERTGCPTALIEINSSSRTTLADAKHLLGYLEDFPGADCYVLSRDPIARIEKGINFLPWAQGMRTLGFEGRVTGF